MLSSLTFPLLSTHFPISLVHHAAPTFPLPWFLFITFDIYVLTQWSPMTFLPLISSLAPARFYQFAVRYFQQLDCSPPFILNLLVTHCLLLSPLPPRSLSSSSIPLSLWCLQSPAPLLLLCSPSHPPLFLPLIFSPVVPRTNSHWRGPKVHLHLCGRLHWTMPWVRALTLGEQCCYGNSVGAMLSYHLHLSPPAGNHITHCVVTVLAPMLVHHHEQNVNHNSCGSVLVNLPKDTVLSPLTAY